METKFKLLDKKYLISATKVGGDYSYESDKLLFEIEDVLLCKRIKFSIDVGSLHDLMAGDSICIKDFNIDTGFGNYAYEYEAMVKVPKTKFNGNEDRVVEEIELSIKEYIKNNPELEGCSYYSWNKNYRDDRKNINGEKYVDVFFRKDSIRG